MLSLFDSSLATAVTLRSDTTAPPFCASPVWSSALTERPAIVAIALETMQASAERPDRVLTELRKSRASLHAVTLMAGSAAAEVGQLADMAERGQVLGEGTRYSGGQRIEVTSTSGVGRSLQQVANELSGQYRITSMLPDGVNPSDRLEVKTKVKDVTFRAPSRMSRACPRCAAGC